ncbi:nucleotidyltransferase [Peribacillus deserti]|uniref:tRNA(Met) cytidine acetate ligase n=2 Tax=Peribacillus deserti TaxID=673318 RepID=A0A2N5M007_9BACI|nr:nucleotidyltransferase [Peribacillus deserti]
MKSLGIVVEYNPFHNGHAYHIQESLKATGADLVIAVMSGNFLQRGEPALVNKWARTKMALKAGVDIVFELPFPFAAQQADIFARGAIGILEAARCNFVCFGSEEGQIEPFLQVQSFMSQCQTEYNSSVKEFSKAGYSYPKASSLAFKKVAQDTELLDLSKPNNILGLQYVQAIKDSYSIQPCTIQRIMADYHSTELGTHPIASATSIRKRLFEESLSIDSVKNQVPSSTVKELLHYLNQYEAFHNWELYWPLLQYKIISSSSSELAGIYEVEEGLQNRFKGAAESAASFKEFMESVKTKRYTWTRLQRVSLNILMNRSKDQMAAESREPAYLRLLGATDKGRQYLHQQKKKFDLPLITKPSSYKEKLETDILASMIHALPLNPANQTLIRKREFQPPVFLDHEKGS